MQFSKLSKKQLLGLVKVALYIMATALVTYAITFIQGNPEFFGALTPIVNLGLVAARDFFQEDK